MISLAMARNLATGHGWAVTPGLPSNTATASAWIVLLAVPMLALPPVKALAVLLTALSAATSLTVSATAKRLGWAWWAGPLAAGGLAASPVMQASVGLESALAVLLLALVAWTAVAERPVWAGVVCGLLVLVRPELAVVVLLVAARWGRRALLVAGAAALTAVPWLVASLVMFGSLVPDTLVWKQGTPGLGYKSIGDGWPLLLAHYPAATALTLAMFGCGLLAGAWWLVRSPRSPVTLLALIGVAHYGTLVALGVGSGFLWYLAPATGCAVLVLAFTAAQAPREALWLPLVGLTAAGAVYTAGHDWATQGGPFMANGALTDQYAAVAARVPTGATVETTHGEVGTIAYFCGTRCRVVDPLSDPGRMSDRIAARLDESPVLRLLYPAWQPSEPVPAQWRTRYADTGVPVWSGYGGWSHLTVEPVTTSPR